MKESSNLLQGSGDVFLRKRDTGSNDLRALEFKYDSQKSRAERHMTKATYKAAQK